MKIKDVVYKLQTPGHGSAYQDEKMLQDFIDDEVAKQTAVLTKQLAEAHGDIAALNKRINMLTDKKGKP